VTEIKTYTDEIDFEGAYFESLDLLRSLMTRAEQGAIGYVASSENIDNYKRLFTRDAFWIGMAAILSEDEELIGAFRSSLEVLMNTQREDGAIPSNVSPGGEISYGVINPRVDPTTLYVIGCIEYCRCRGGKKDLEYFKRSIERAMKYLENTWENKSCGLLYIPRAGNWADEYFQKGFVLYDEVLWHIALKKSAYALKVLGNKRASVYLTKSGTVKNTIRDKFWLKNNESKEDPVYLTMRKKIDMDRMGYLMHFYYANRRTKACFAKSHCIFDAFGNSLAVLAGVASKKQIESILRFVDMISVNWYPLVPAHYPFFREKTFKTKKLSQYRFKEFIGHYHNGGLWPWYTGAYVAGLVRVGEEKRATRFLHGILRANASEKNGKKFYEYHTAQKSTAVLEIVHPHGLDLYFSEKLCAFMTPQKSNLRIKFKNRKVDVTDGMCVRTLNAKKGDKIQISTVGPDAKDVLLTIAFFKDKEGNRYFRNIEMNKVKSEPDGTPNLGVSAAAYVIAYKAVAENKILFEQKEEKDEK
jgi:phosphotransferase system HPr-like phosphotransfer protein